MTKASFTSILSSKGSCLVGDTSTSCCLSRSGNHEVSGNFKRMFRQYGRSTSWFADRSSAVANLPNGVTWEEFYYADSYKYNLTYRTKENTSNGSNGAISITLRAHAAMKKISISLTESAPELFTAVTEEEITKAFAEWDNAIQEHWTKRKYTVELGAPDCPGVFPIDFKVVEELEAEKAHVEFSVLHLKHPQEPDPTSPKEFAYPAWAEAFKDPSNPKHATAQRLAEEWRSNAGKFNLGDSRGALVFAHEYGHWMGWGDEYIEVSGTVTHPVDPKAGEVLAEKKGDKIVSLRVAVRITNPTQNHQRGHDSIDEDIDLSASESSNWLMADMESPQTYPARYVYTIVDDFIRLYNQDNNGGGTSAYCINVT